MTGLALGAVSFNIAGAIAASGVGETTLTAAIKNGDLIAHYVGTKPVIRAVDLDEWIQSLPTESARKAS